MPHFFKRLLALTPLAAALAAPLTGQAAVYVADFDPEYGSPYAGLSFRGTATIFVPNECLSQGNYIFTSGSSFPQTIGGGCSGDDMRIESATLELYETAQPELSFSVTLTPGNQTLFPIINFVRIEAGEVNGLNTDFFGAFDFTGSELSVATPAELWMYFLEPGPASLQEPAATRNGQTPLAAPTTQVFVCDSDPGLNTQACGNGNLSNPASVGQFTRIPEPGSVALSLLALAAAGLQLRRRRGR